MRMPFDPAKRAKTLPGRGLACEAAAIVFQDSAAENEDTRCPVDW